MVEQIHDEWGAFVTSSDAPPFLHLKVSFVEADPDAVVTAFQPKLMKASFGEGCARFRMPEGEAEVSDDGSGTVSLLARPGQTPYYTLHNLLRGCLAWRLPRRGGALLHAAGLVVNGRAFLLLGPSGSGKTTWARIGSEAGATVVGDDLVLLDGSGSVLEALGSPFRSFHVADYRPGRWPVGAILFPTQGAAAAWSECSPAKAQSRIVASLPFISAALERDQRIADVVTRVAREIPALDLTFGLDDSFMALLRSF
jgi:hypothetical protein